MSEGSATNSKENKSRLNKKSSNYQLRSKTLQDDISNEVFDEENDFDEWVARIDHIKTERIENNEEFDI